MKKLILILCLFFSTSAVAQNYNHSNRTISNSQQERILNYNAIIDVQTDASVIVTENITVNRMGRNIRRGIYRDLPLTKGVTYELLSVRRDGKLEPSFTENVRGHFRINTGNNNYLPRNGVYTFEIKYKATNVILAFDDYDEIYWNVTGNDWIFPINRVSAKVILPNNAPVKQSSVYVGKKGSKKQGNISSNGIFYANNLFKGDGMTVAVGFEKGYVTVPEQPFLSKYLDYLWGVFFTYLFITWAMYGKDPDKGVIIPQFTAVPNLSSAEASWIYHYGNQSSDYFSVALLQAGVSGFLKIENDSDNEFNFIKQREPETKEEKFLNEKITKTFSIKDKYDPKIQNIISNFKGFLQKRTGKNYFTPNKVLNIFAVIIFLAVLNAIGFQKGYESLTALLSLYSIFFIPILSEILNQIIRKKFSIATFIVTIFITFHCFTMIAGHALLSPELLTMWGIGIICLVAYFHLIIRPSAKGQEVIAHIDGIKLFLETIDPTQSKIVNVDNMEKLLPYAFFLGLEKEWEEKMRFVSSSTYQPNWYSGKRFSYGAFRTMSNTVSKAGTRPSKSGSGGGGFSGGGFGGGGGGGR